MLLLNVGQHHATAVTDDLCRGINDKGVGCVPEPLLHVRPECFLAFIRKSDIALCDGDGIHRLTVQQHLPLPGLGVEDAHGDLLSPCLSLLLQINFYVLRRMIYRWVAVGRMRHGMMPFCSIHAAFLLLTWSIL